MTSSTLLPKILLSVLKGQPKALQDSHYPAWHLAPATGLLNDPNGFIHFQGRFHLFYQWNPLGCQHNHKCWGHWSSADLLHWQHEPIALMPEEEYDRSGCYSGSAVDNQGELTLCYTGNVKFAEGGRTAWQCLAVQNAEGGFDKSGLSSRCRRDTPGTSEIPSLAARKPVVHGARRAGSGAAR
jgi:beta-fructofuranosidase